MKRVRISVPTSCSTREVTPNSMFHATPWAALRAIDTGQRPPIQSTIAAISARCAASSVNM
jgi:hypothetical protein